MAKSRGKSQGAKPRGISRAILPLFLRVLRAYLLHFSEQRSLYRHYSNFRDERNFHGALSRLLSIVCRFDMVDFECCSKIIASAPRGKSDYLTATCEPLGVKPIIFEQQRLIFIIDKIMSRYWVNNPQNAAQMRKYGILFSKFSSIAPSGKVE